MCAHPIAGPAFRRMGDLDPDVQHYLSELQMAGRAHATLRIRTIQLRGWTAWLAAQGLRPSVATRADVVDYLTQFSEPETRASYRAAVRCFHAWLVDTGRASENPARAIPSVRRPTRPRTHITDREVLDAIAAATPDVAAMIILGRLAGLRAAEIAAAHRSYLRGPVGEEVVGLIGKGDRWREVPAHPMVADLLRRSDGYLFPSNRYSPGHVSPATVSHIVGCALPGCWTAHSLRRAFASEAYARTKDLLLVQRWLGHTDSKTTLGYIDIDQDHAAMRRMGLVA